MSRYIDIEPVLEWCGDPEVCEPYGINSVELERKLYDAPSIDIVHCRECEFEWTQKCPPHRMGLIHDESDYCSYGIRRK